MICIMHQLTPFMTLIYGHLFKLRVLSNRSRFFFYNFLNFTNCYHAPITNKNRIIYVFFSSVMYLAFVIFIQTTDWTKIYKKKLHPLYGIQNTIQDNMIYIKDSMTRARMAPDRIKHTKSAQPDSMLWKSFRMESGKLLRNRNTLISRNFIYIRCRIW